MKRVCSSVLVLLLAGFAAPLAAGVVYVPVPPLEGEFEIHLEASNADEGEPRRFTVNYLPLNTDGSVDPRATPSALTVLEGRATKVVVPSSHLPGLLELNSAPQLSYSAKIRSINGGESLASSLPVITSANVHKADEYLRVQGLLRNGNGTVTDIAVANLGKEAAHCTASLNAANGDAFGDALIELRPLSMAYFADVIGLFGETAAGDVVFHLSCDQRYYAFGVTKDGTGGAIRIERPAARGSSLFRLPGEPEPEPDPPPGGGGDPDPEPGPGGSLVFTRPGLIHQARPGQETAVYNVAVPPNTVFARAEIEFEVYNGGWYPACGNNCPNHSLFWFHRGFANPAANQWSPWRSHVLAFVNVFPTQGRSRLMTNYEQGDLRSSWDGGQGMQPGETYRVRYVRDNRTGEHSVTISELSGAVVASIRASTLGRSLRSDSSGYFFVYFGHEDEGHHGPARPSYNWRWSNLTVRLVP